MGPSSPQSLETHHSRFYRPSRSPLPPTPGEQSRHFSAQSSLSRRTPSASLLMVSPLEGPPIGEQPIEYFATRPSSPIHSESPVDSIQGSSPPASMSEVAESSRPLGPRWNDYSFREADLFYSVPPPTDAELFNLHDQPRNQPLNPNKWTWNFKFDGGALFGWKRVPPEQGFSVVRPNRVPPSRANIGNQET